MIKDKKITGLKRRRKKWLNAHGGRNEGDCLSDEKGYYVLYRDGLNEKDYKKYLPDNLQDIKEKKEVV